MSRPDSLDAGTAPQGMQSAAICLFCRPKAMCVSEKQLC